MSCHRPCGRLLTCTNHTCRLECHKVVGSPDDHKVHNCPHGTRHIATFLFYTERTSFSNVVVKKILQPHIVPFSEYDTQVW